MEEALLNNNGIWQALQFSNGKIGINRMLMERHHKLMMELKNGIKDLMEICEMKGKLECKRYWLRFEKSMWAEMKLEFWQLSDGLDHLLNSLKNLKET